MPDELIDIVDENGNPTGVQHMKSYAHKKGLLHASIHVWIINHHKELLFQRRALNKDTFPGLWDVSTAGHIGADENAKIAALREVNEEIGIQLGLKDLHYVAKWHEKHIHPNQIIDNEIHHIYIAQLSIDIEDLQFQEEEVMAARFLALDSFQNKITTGVLQDYVPHSIDYYQFVIDNLKATF